MAHFLAAKAPSEVVQRRWAVPVDKDDGALSVATSASGVTVDEDGLEGDDLVLTLSAGVAAATGSVVATITTSRGRTLVETLYIPVVESAAQIAGTARDYCGFALRKIVGLGEDASSNELDDALEQLNSMIAAWRAGGADIGCAFPITANTVIYCPDWVADAIRYNLRVRVYSLYEQELAASDLKEAVRGLQLVKHKNLPDERKAAYF